MIGIITAIVGEFANLFGCVIGLKSSVTAITIVGMGTSLPDTLASMKAARDSDGADPAIGNVTGSNSVNVFLGLGIPWVMATIIKTQQGYEGYNVPAGDLTFSVAVFLSCAVIGFIILITRRVCLGGELGGPQPCRSISFVLFILLWATYITLCTMRAYGSELTANVF